MFKVIATAVLVAVTTLSGAGASFAEEWRPKGPITLKISFRAGGGTDTQARLIASELTKRHGWEIIPQNVAGKGGAVMARDLADDPADGLTIGMTVTEALTYSPFAMRDAGYALEDFDLLTTTAGTQMALFAKASRGWATMHDVIAAAKSGDSLSVGAFSPRVADAIYLLSQKTGVDFKTVMVKGGKGSINGVMADDLDIAWGAGPQNKLVASGDLVNLVSGEDEALSLSPDAPLLSEFDVPYTFGAKFLFIAPKGIPAEAKEALTNAIVEVINDESTEANGFITKAFSGVQVIRGSELEAYMAQNAADDAAMLQVVSE